MSVLFDIAWTNNEHISRDWRELFVREKLVEQLSTILAQIERSCNARNICPNAENIIAFTRYPLDEVSVVIIGMDPYPNQAHATGFAFSIPNGIKPPPSLRSIFSALVSQGLMHTDHIGFGNLERWSAQGVLLLNNALTTVATKTGAHMAIWTPFTIAIVCAICRARRGTIFMLFGRDAQKLKSHIVTNGGQALEWGHPSPLNPANHDPMNAQHFIHCTTFAMANNILASNGRPQIVWDPRHDTIQRASLCHNEEINMTILDPLDELNPPDLRDVVYAFVDGSCCAHPIGRVSRTIISRREVAPREYCAGYAVVIISRDKMVTIRGLVSAFPDTKPTNNRAELCAMMALFNYMAQREFIEEFGNNTPAIIIYDSEYAAGCIREWYERWIQYPPNEIKANRDIISITYEKMKQVNAARELEWIHVYSHLCEPNNTADPHDWFYWKGNQFADTLASGIVAECLANTLSQLH